MVDSVQLLVLGVPGPASVQTPGALPVAIGNPDINEVRVLRTREGLAGIERQTNRFRVELGLGCGSATEDPKWFVLIAFWAVPSKATADREELHVFGQEAQIRVVVGLN